MKVSNTSERLKKIMRERNLRQVDILQLTVPVARKYNLDFTKGNLSMYVTGRVVPGQDKLLILAEALDVSEAWLMGYDVAPDRKIPTDFVLQLSPEEKAIIETAAASPASKEMLMDYAKKLAQLNQLKDETGR